MNIVYRKGSALLIVLGMMAFMIVSAVGFSVYMRQSRAPSSHLRRESTARYLLKSALANAISRIDGEMASRKQIWGDEDRSERNASSGFIEGVYNDPYPGVGRIAASSSGSSFDSTSSGDHGYWGERGGYFDHRVFTPFGPVSPLRTVPTLTLEGLAYLPPALINEARVYSRTTRTAKWRNLSYDLGRYAFCAIDVSDCFDINKLRANRRRSSAAGDRVNLSSLYEDSASALDGILEKAWKRDAKSGVPFVSLADFNMVAQGSPFAPFTKIIDTKGTRMIREGDVDVENALFITDTWFPPTNYTGNISETYDFNLALGAGEEKSGQPFSDYGIRSFLELDEGGFSEALYKNIGGVGLACLYDYLDRDQRPISLALPTVETAPMICGLSIANTEGVSLNFGKARADGFPVEYIKKDSKGIDRKIERDIQGYCFTGIESPAGVAVSGVAVFPFKRISSTPNRKKTWKVETLVGVFFATDGMRCRSDNDAMRPTKEIWNNPGVRDGVCWYKGESQPLSFPDDISKAENAVVHFRSRLTSSGAVKMPIAYHVKETDKTEKDPDVEYGEITLQDQDTVDAIRKDPSAFRVHGNTGAIDTEWNNTAGKGNDALYGKTELEGGKEQKWEKPAGVYKPYFCVWARVTEGSYTVDMAPASFADDEIWLDGCSYGSLKDNDRMAALCGKGVPLLDFKGDKEFRYENFDTLASSGMTVNFGWQALYALDPRYNFAPEDWFADDGSDATKEGWLNHVGAQSGGVIGGDNRDRDIFMFTSDQEYLQSIGELAFLPYVQEMTGNAGFLDSGFANLAKYHGRNDFNERNAGSVNSFANGAYMWRTYGGLKDLNLRVDPYRHLRYNGSPMRVVSSQGDFRVNPFSPDPRIMSAVIRDTPQDWYIASTNKDTNTKYNMTLEQSLKFAFGPDGEDAKGTQWNDDKCEEIAQKLISEFSSAARDGDSDIDEIFADMGWYDGNVRGDDQKRLFGVDLPSPLHEVDRKFLYSYWRECFQNRQQLFLVFIRAEPLTVGGSSGDAIANAQLGARGVALVWRDPEPPARPDRRALTSRQVNRTQWRDAMQKSGPHRTRVLFYHQFD